MIQCAQEALENVLAILESPGAQSILTPDLVSFFLDEHERLMQELAQVRTVEASRLVKLWELPASRTISEKCTEFKSRMERFFQSKLSDNLLPVVSNQGGPLPSSGTATNGNNNTDSPRFPIAPLAGSDGYMADESSGLYSPAISTPPATKHIYIPSDTGSSLHGPVTYPADSLAQVSPGPASTATQRPATSTRARTPVADTPSRVTPVTSTTKTSEPTRYRASEDSLTAWTPEGVNSIKGISVNGESVDGFTINLGGHGTSGAYINKAPMYLYPNPPGA